MLVWQWVDTKGIVYICEGGRGRRYVLGPLLLLVEAY